MVMKIIMKIPNFKTTAEIQQFLTNTNNLEIEIKSYQDKYQFIEETLRKVQYRYLSKLEKGIVRQYIAIMTKYSRAQINLLISRYQQGKKIKRKKSTRINWTQKYSNQEIMLLAKTDEAHGFINGCAIKEILRREAEVYGKKEYTNISKISVTHLYNLRKSLIYKKLAKKYEPTKPKVSNIGERRKPQPNESPGYLRVDTVHQGDMDGEKGVYHINMVDEVLQFEFVGAVEGISESYLIPLLEQLLTFYPYVIIEFHSDNGSEYINYKLVDILNRLLIKLSKSRPLKHNDNALVESKNGSIIRKWMGYTFIPKGVAKQINDFYFGYFNEYINYHRPCGYATIITDKKGKRKKIYKQENYKTPYEKLRSLPSWEQYLKPDITAKQLQKTAERYSDTEMAEIVQRERNKLFDLIDMSL